jgi:hypothetical protein
MAIGVLTITLGTMTLAAPAFADNERYRLEVPAYAPASGTLTGITGSCAGDGSPSLLSDAFTGGKATVTGADRFTATAGIVGQAGIYPVTLVCAGGRVAVDEVTVH